jgi:pimeloyl-ACP methyl ester carboxylesterase
MVPMASRHACNGDVRVHYLDSDGCLDADGGPGAPIVFVPGMTDIADDYADVMPLFGRRTVVVEVRGHGRSSSPPSGYDLQTLTGDVGAVIDAVTDGPVHIMTFSRGTSCAVAWAIENPERVRSLAIGDYVPEERVVASAAAQRLLEGRWRGTPVRERLDVRAATQTFHAARARSMWEPLARLRLPLLVVRSGASVLVDDADWSRYRALFPGAHLVEFSDSPHDIFRPDRARYPQLVRGHVDRADRAGR